MTLQESLEWARGRLAFQDVRVGDHAARFRIGERVRPFHREDDPESTGIIVGVVATPDGFYFNVAWPGRTDESRHYALELAPIPFDEGDIPS